MLMRCIAASCCCLGLATVAAASHQHEFSDFEFRASPAWYGNYPRSETPIGQRHFLGPFGNGSVMYFVMDAITTYEFPGPQPVLMEFDLFVMGNWSGNDTSAGDADRFKLNVSRVFGTPEESMIDTSFSNLAGSQQAFPGEYPGGAYAADTSSTELGTLGYGVDAVYHIRRSAVSHTSGGDLFFYFTVSGLPDGATWGLDNVDARWITIPEPATFTLAALTAIGLLAVGLRRRQNHRAQCRRSASNDSR